MLQLPFICSLSKILFRQTEIPFINLPMNGIFVFLDYVR